MGRRGDRGRKGDRGPQRGHRAVEEMVIIINPTSYLRRCSCTRSKKLVGNK
jgi:hypothetical protein